ncbi:MAG: Hsp20/alpha crystallin family protein [Chlamydiota bacterium]
MNEKKKKKEPKLDIDFGSNSWGLGSLFDGINKLVDLAQKVEEAGGELKKEGEFKSNGREGIFGFSVRNIVGKDGKETPVVQPFGNIKKTDKGTVVQDAREPIVDIFKTDDTIQIIAELPGVLESELNYTIEEDLFSISTTGSKKYSKEVVLPYPVFPEPIESNYNAGIWELKFKKKTKK